MTARTAGLLTRGVLQHLAQTLTGQMIAQQVSAAQIDKQCRTAFEHGWTNPDELATLALAGCAGESVESPAALFTSQLQNAAARPPYIHATEYAHSPKYDYGSVCRHEGCGAIPGHPHSAACEARRNQP